MFVVFATLSTIIYNLKGDNASMFDWFCNLTTLSYYGIGGKAIDWYLSVLFIFYLLYPIVYLCIKKYKLGGVILTLLIVFIITSYHDFSEYYGCALSRIPIFVLGIYLYSIRESNKLTRHYLICTLFFSLISVLAILLLKRGYRIHGYFLLDTITPAFILVLALLTDAYRKLRIAPGLDGILSFLGKYSLEIYIANYLSMNVCGLIKGHDIYTSALIYILLNTVGTLILIYTNKRIMRFIK